MKSGRPLEAITCIVDGLQFPEGEFWSARDHCVYFVEWAGDRILALRGGKVEVVKVVALSPEGRPLARIYLKGAKPTNTAFDADEKALYVTEGELGLLYRVDLRQATVGGPGEGG